MGDSGRVVFMEVSPYRRIKIDFKPSKVIVIQGVKPHFPSFQSATLHLLFISRMLEKTTQAAAAQIGHKPGTARIKDSHSYKSSLSPGVLGINWQL
jgi:hypothetical protein